MDSLTPEQQQLLNEKKIELRLGNETYLRAHPELNQLTSFFLAKVIEDRPESIVEYAAGFFTQKDLKSQVDTAVEEARAAARRVQGKK